MSQELWTAVDGYFADLLAPVDPALEAALRDSADAGLPPIQVSPLQGKLLQLLAIAQGARAILEIGTLGGYSTIWLARALPAGGRLITLEADPRHAEIARANISRAGLAGVVELRLGQALDMLPQLAAEGRGPFDLIFIDADKPAYPDYLAWALRLSRRGSLIVADNVVRKGAVIDPASPDPDVQGVRRFNEMLATLDTPRGFAARQRESVGGESRATDRHLSATALQTVGVKGYDGLALAVVTADA